MILKFQVELLSYTIFALIVISISSFLIFYFYFLRDIWQERVNFYNLYNVLNILESPILTFNSVCDYCKVSFSLNLNTSIPRNYLYLISSSENSIFYDELYSKSRIQSSLLNLNSSYFIDFRASSDKLITVFLDKLNRIIKISSS